MCGNKNEQLVPQFSFYYYIDTIYRKFFLVLLGETEQLLYVSLDFGELLLCLFIHALLAGLATKERVEGQSEVATDITDHQLSALGTVDIH